MDDWSLYILSTRMDTLYTGISRDVARRLREHTEGRVGAKYLRSKAPLKVVYQVSLGSRELASRAEYRIKQLTRQEKQALIDRQPGTEELLQLLALNRQLEETV